MNHFRVTEAGKAVAHAAFAPASAAFFLNYFSRYWESLAALVSPHPLGDDAARNAFDQSSDDLAFIIFHLCYCSPEFSADPPRRFLPYPLGDQRQSDRGRRLSRLLAYQPWDANMLAVNGADISVDWRAGVTLRELENRFNALRGGMIRDMHNAAASLLSGMADLLTSALLEARKPEPIAAAAWIKGPAQPTLLRLVRRIRQYALQAIVGLPDEMIWTAQVTSPDGQTLIKRPAAMFLLREGITTLEDLLDQGRTDRLLAAFGGGGPGRGLVDRVRTAAQRVRSERTAAHRTRLKRRLPDCAVAVDGFFDSREKAFEDALGDCLQCVGIEILDRDQGDGRRPRYPDFLLKLDETTRVVLECKSSPVGRDIDIGVATDVGGKALVHGLNDNHQVTLCQQYVRTDVPRLIEAARNLSVINAEDMASALGYLKSGSISKARFIAWITTPGQPRVEELFRN